GVSAAGAAAGACSRTAMAGSSSFVVPACGTNSRRTVPRGLDRLRFRPGQLEPRERVLRIERGPAREALGHLPVAFRQTAQVLLCSFGLVRQPLQAGDVPVLEQAFQD